MNLANTEGNTPLHWACVNGKKEAVRVLMQAGANASSLNSHEATPVDEALVREFQDIVDLINECTRGSGKPTTAEVDDIPDDAEEVGEGGDGDGDNIHDDMAIDGQEGNEGESERKKP